MSESIKKYEKEIIQSLQNQFDQIEPNMSLKKLYDVVDSACDSLQKLHKKIKCPSGCNTCCKTFALPRIYEMEWDYLVEAMDSMDAKIKEKVRRRVLNNSKKFSKNGDLNKDLSKYKNFQCPLLIDGRCSVYEKRPFYCRSHGYFLSDIKVYNNSINLDNPHSNIMSNDFSVQNRIRSDSATVRNNKRMLASESMIGDHNIEPTISHKVIPVFATCEDELKRWTKEINADEEKYRIIPIKSNFKDILESINTKNSISEGRISESDSEKLTNEEKNPHKYLFTYLRDYFENTVS